MTSNIMNELNKQIAEHFPELMRTSATYIYFTDKKGNRFFYTTNRINCGCKQMPPRGHYVAGKYLYIKKYNHFKLSKKRCFAKKHKALGWADNEHDKAIEKQTKQK